MTLIFVCRLAVLYLVILFSSINQVFSQEGLSSHARPNIVLIMADDLGFSDIGCYGGEIETPRLDELAKNGLRYKQFYNAARCCPSRAALMTGLYPHQTGMGWMAAADLGTPAYSGNLNNTSVTIAEVLRSAGYSTYMTGKWHLTNERKIAGGVTDNWPAQRGFDRYFGIIPGASNFFTPTVYSGNHSYKAPKDYYFTHAISDTSVAYIEDHFRSDKENPFFLYVAYTAPHWPLHALQPEIDKYVNRYEKGWDRIRQARYDKIHEMGLIRQDGALSPRDNAVQAWDELSKAAQDDMVMRMAIYAAQIDLMDQGIGRIMDALHQHGQLDNTLVFFLSDNGACAEFISRGEGFLDGTSPRSYESYRQEWANVSSTPFREYKHYVQEGGIASPLVVHWPNGIRPSLNNSFVEGYGHIIDLMATCADVAGAPYPKKHNGHIIQPLEGKSLVPHFSGEETDRGKIFWEHEANVAMRDGKWKMVSKTEQRTDFDKASLELYDMEADPSELRNLASVYPQKLKSMYREWSDWASRVGVFPLDTRTYGEKSQAYRRTINGEFDDNLGDWIIHQATQGLANVSVDTTGAISGKNSAKVMIQRRAFNADQIALRWPYRAKKGEKFAVKIAAKSDRPIEIIVALEPVAGGTPLFIEKIQVSDNITVHNFDSDLVPHDAQYRVSMKLGKAPVGTSIWLDGIQLNAFQ